MSGIRHEEVEDAELGGRESDVGISPRHLVCLGVELEPVDFDAGLGVLLRGCLDAAQDRANPCDELLELERLGEEVIGSQVEDPQNVLGVAPTGEDEYRRLVVGTDATQDLEPIEARQTKVEDDEVRTVGSPSPQGRCAVRGLHHDESLSPKDIRGQVEHVEIVFDQQDLDHEIHTPMRVAAHRATACRNRKWDASMR